MREGGREGERVAHFYALSGREREKERERKHLGVEAEKQAAPPAVSYSYR